MPRTNRAFRIEPVAAPEILYAIRDRMGNRTMIMVTDDNELLGLPGRVIHPATRVPHRRGRVSCGLVVAMLAGALAVVLAGGCLRSSKETRTVTMGSPHLSEGVFIDTATPMNLQRIAAALDQMDLDPSGIRLDGAELAAARDAVDALPVDELPAIDVLLSAAPDLAVAPLVPPNAVRLITLPRLSVMELGELVDRVVLHVSAVQGYAEADPALAEDLPMPPEGVVPGRLLSRVSPEGTRVLRFGHRRFVSQPPQLWVLGVEFDDGTPLHASGDLDLVEPAVTAMIASLESMRSSLTVRDLESKLIQLGYSDASTAISMLEGLGVTALDDPSALPETVEFGALPFVFKVPDPESRDTGLIGEQALQVGEFGVSLAPNIATQLSPNLVASPMTQLLVMFHPAHPEQFSRVKRLLDEFVDRPARQIFVEGMVLEINEDGLKDLGVEWELNSGDIMWRFGSPSANGQTDTMNFLGDDIDFNNLKFDWKVEIRTLITEGKAEVLARPAVLTMNNRQSTIRIGQDVPIATSQEGGSGLSDKIAFNFRYIPTGILLNIRPRINADGSEVSMLVDTIVSAEEPGGDLEIRSNDGELLASAPTISTRRVQTYARIDNNTPFIIGGLVSHRERTQLDKVPILGDLPIIGMAFRSERTETEKQEVIIVLTPSVLPEDQAVMPGVPKDADTFDSFGHELFRDIYRIRAEDVFDVAFLFENPRMAQYRELAQHAMARNFRLTETMPFQEFAGGNMPGEQMIVTRMLYEVVKRLAADDSVPLERIIFFEGQQTGGLDVSFLERMLVRLGGGREYQTFFRNHPDKALAITYFYDVDDAHADRITSEPKPELSLIPCRDRREWTAKMKEENVAEGGRGRYTILIHDPADLVRLRRALILKRLISLNGGNGNLRMRNFRQGKIVMMPDVNPDHVHVMDAEVARLFYYTEFYYKAAIDHIESTLHALDEALMQPDVRVLLSEE